MSTYERLLVEAYRDELEKIATPGLMNEPTVHKHNRKWAARLGGIAAVGAAGRPLIEHYYARYRPHMRDTLRRAGKRATIAGLATGVLSLGALEGITAMTKKRRDEARAMIEARQAAKRAESEKTAEFTGKHLGALSLAAIMAGTGLGYEKNHGNGEWSGLPRHVVEHVTGAPFDRRTSRARELADLIAKQPKVRLADSPKFVPKIPKVHLASVSTQALANMGHGVELAGLGVLAKPSIDRLRGKKVDEHKAAKQEIAGLGILAAPSAIHLAHSAYKYMKPGLRGV